MRDSDGCPNTYITNHLEVNNKNRFREAFMPSCDFADIGDAKSADSLYVLGKSWISEFAGLGEPAFHLKRRTGWSEWRVDQWIEQIGQRI
jgi:hypothetical protein